MGSALSSPKQELVDTNTGNKKIVTVGAEGAEGAEGAVGAEGVEGAEGASTTTPLTGSAELKNTTKVPTEQVITNEKKYGDINFISWYCTVLSRFAYMIDKDFITYYYKVFGPVIPVDLLKAMNDYIKTIDSARVDLTYFLEDYKMFKDIPDYTAANFNLSVGNGIDLKLSTHKHKYSKTEEGNYIDFIPLSAIVNAVIDEIPEELTPKQFSDNEKSIIANAKTVTFISNPYLKYISIATSNYGEIYVSCDTRFPNMINVLFRGTYSPKTAASYIKGSSIIAYNVGVNSTNTINENYLYGIFKLLSDVIHTLFNTIIYLAKTHLIPEIKDNNSNITLITTGHSLGGGLTTIFSYVWAEHIQYIYENTKNNNTNDPVYTTMNRINKKIICISLAAPRVMSVTLADYFCNTHIMKNVYFKRLTVNGDLVPSQPYTANFAHPCSSTTYKKYMNSKENEKLLIKRKSISEDCSSEYVYGERNLTSQDKTNTNTLDYNADLNCTNEKDPEKKDKKTPLKHMYYLDISFRGAVYIADFTAKYLVVWTTFLTYFTFEVPRTIIGSTVCRLVFYEGTGYTQNVFFNLNNLRNRWNNPLTSTAKLAVTTFTGELIEDVLMNYDCFEQFKSTQKKKDIPIANSPAVKWNTSLSKILTTKVSTNQQSEEGTWISFIRPSKLTNNELKDFFSTTEQPSKIFTSRVVLTLNPSQQLLLDNDTPQAEKSDKEAFKREVQTDQSSQTQTQTQPIESTTGGSRRIQKRSKQNKTNRRKGRRQNKSKRRNKRNKRISKRHNKTRK